MITREQVIDILRTVNDPELHRSIVDLKMVDGIEIHDGLVKIGIKLTIPGCPLKARIESDVTKAVTAIDGVRKVNIRFGSMNQEEKAAVRSMVMGQPKPEEAPLHIADQILAISSGKGGVGKSTVTANLARSFAEKGYKVAVLDADVYGFSIPRMLGVTTRPTVVDNMIIPAEQDKIKVVSMGFFVPDDTPVIWRGPLLHKTITQFMTDVVWDNPDILLMDLPPGTGDVTITIGQKLPTARLIVVTTPQAAAANVAGRVAAMAEKTNFSLLGVIENMSYYQLPDNSKEFIFGSGGGRLLASRAGTAFFGEIPLHRIIRECADSGKSLFDHADGHHIADAYRTISDRIAATF
jgi:ATP-binding protein involved in chromosome partitioning